jgi:glycosyltransferase involved in cell wall biosynthesis
VVLTLHDGKLVCPSYLMLDASRGSVCADCGGRSFYRAVSRRCQGSAGKGLLLAAEAYWHRLRRSYDGVDLFLAPSRFLADLMTSRRLPGARVRVLRNGIDTSRYLPSRRDEGYALYFGRLSREKGVETLLRAHAAHASRVPLKVVGTGPLEAELRARFPAAEFLGYRTGRVLEKLVSDSSCVVVPSEWYENCSMVVLEAMAFGKPVIGSRMGGIPEQVEDGVTGYLFPMGDEQELAQRLLRLWDDPSLRGAMGAAGRAKLEREYSLERHCAELLSIYRDLMEA